MLGQRALLTLGGVAQQGLHHRVERLLAEPGGALLPDQIDQRGLGRFRERRAGGLLEAVEHGVRDTAPVGLGGHPYQRILDVVAGLEARHQVVGQRVRRAALDQEISAEGRLLGLVGGRRAGRRVGAGVLQHLEETSLELPRAGRIGGEGGQIQLPFEEVEGLQPCRAGEEGQGLEGPADHVVGDRPVARSKGRDFAQHAQGLHRLGGDRAAQGLLEAPLDLVGQGRVRGAGLEQLAEELAAGHVDAGGLAGALRALVEALERGLDLCGLPSGRSRRDSSSFLSCSGVSTAGVSPIRAPSTASCIACSPSTCFPS